MTNTSQKLREVEQEIMESLFDLFIDKTQEERIRMGEILDRLGKNITKTQLTNIVRRKLEPLGYVDYLPYEGILLKNKGFQAARKIARNHRLAEAMLYQLLDVPFTILHEEACAIEHGITDRMAVYIFNKLPIKKTPFGMPIPMGEVQDLGCNDKCLLDIPVGTPVTLTRISGHSNNTATELVAYGINNVGVKLLIKEIESDGVIIELNDEKSGKYKIPLHLSKILCVKPIHKPN